MAASKTALRLLSTPLQVTDDATRAMEALRQGTMAAHMRIEQEKQDLAAERARWRKTLEHERLRRPHRPSPTEAAALALPSRNVCDAIEGYNPDEPGIVQTPAKNLQATTVLVDRLNSLPHYKPYRARLWSYKTTSTTPGSASATLVTSCQQQPATTTTQNADTASGGRKCCSPTHPACPSKNRTTANRLGPPMSASATKPTYVTIFGLV